MPGVLTIDKTAGFSLSFRRSGNTRFHVSWTVVGKSGWLLDPKGSSRVAAHSIMPARNVVCHFLRYFAKRPSRGNGRLALVYVSFLVVSFGSGAFSAATSSLIPI